jgi:hypothetical protein
MSSRRRRQSVGGTGGTGGSVAILKANEASKEEAPTPAPARTHDAHCYSCLEASKENLIPCPQCTVSVHRSCLYTFELVRQFGSLERAYQHSNPLITRLFQCPNKHNFFHEGYTDNYKIVKNYGLRWPSWQDAGKSIMTLLMLAAFDLVYWRILPQYYLPVAVGMLLSVIQIYIIFTPNGTKVWDHDPRLLGLLGGVLFFAVYGGISLIQEHLPWYKILIPAALLMNGFGYEVSFLVFLIATPLIWTHDTKMMDWLTPWLIEKISIVLVNSLLGLICCSYLLSFQITYNLRIN